MSATVVTKPWMQERPWRDSNPGDLRVRHRPPPWPGQTAIDERGGGPFAIFGTRAEGWAALGLWLFLAHDEWQWTSISKMIGAFAPPTENNTSAYVDLVCNKLHTGPFDAINVHNRGVREAMMRAIALAEAGPRVDWPDAEVQAGLMLTEAHWPAFLAAYQRGNTMVTAAAKSSTDNNADVLNAAQLNKGKPA
jgi:hypothetical protein